MRTMVSSSKHPPKPRVTIEVEAAWLEHARPGSGGVRRAAVPPPLPPGQEQVDGEQEEEQPAPLSVRSGGAPPPLTANTARHNTMPVEAQWLEVSELDAKLRASLAPLPPPPDDRTRARMSTPIPREDPDDEPRAATSVSEETRPVRRARTPSSARTTKSAAKKTAKKTSNKG